VVGQGTARQLQVEFAQPAAGAVSLRIEMVPRLALAPGQWPLRLPAPVQGTPADGKLAYRLEGVEPAHDPQNLAIAVVKTEKFADEWQAATSEALTLTRASSFRRLGPGATLNLRVQPRRPVAGLDARWRLGPQGAELDAHLDLSADNDGDELSVVELTVPA